MNQFPQSPEYSIRAVRFFLIRGDIRSSRCTTFNIFILQGVKSLVLFPLFATGVVDTGGKLTPVPLMLVVHLDLRISQRIFEKILNDPNVIFRALGKMIHENPEAKNLVTLFL
jgi:hypothetical protein